MEGENMEGKNMEVTELAIGVPSGNTQGQVKVFFAPSLLVRRGVCALGSAELRFALHFKTRGVAALVLPGGVLGGLRALEIPNGRFIKVRADASIEDFADALSR
eukprot:1154028-Pelagomonas_calceolata.AAC.6